MPVYNCSDVVLKALQSIDGLVDEIKCFECRWIGHNGPNNSPDDTIAVIKEWREKAKTKVTLYHFDPMYEWESYNEILKGVDIGDWVFQFSSDEEILEWGKDVREILSVTNEKAFRIFFHLLKPYAALISARLYKKTETVYFDRDHRYVYDKDGWIDIPHSPTIHILIDHQPETDAKKDRKNMKEYSIKNYKQEHGD